MLPYASDKPLMTDAQYRAMQAVIERDGDQVARWQDTRTVATLIAMAKPTRGWAEIRWTQTGLRRQITHAVLTGAGRRRFEAETARRAAVIERQRILDKALGRGPVVTAQGPATDAGPLRSLAAKADPFALVSAGKTAVHPDSPYGDEIPF